MRFSLLPHKFSNLVDCLCFAIYISACILCCTMRYMWILLLQLRTVICIRVWVEFSIFRNCRYILDLYDTWNIFQLFEVFVCVYARTVTILSLSYHFQCFFYKTIIAHKQKKKSNFSGFIPSKLIWTIKNYVKYHILDFFCILTWLRFVSRFSVSKIWITHDLNTNFILWYLLN